ncbi:MAG TPA: FtsQ-type POTRA domain-containing protein [Brevundimonas sp.]|uniref:cell division protein FtsQ/DivIB n=1 Tax=Brevundimonas sp. TaxID=1871086 RepID=UPI00263302E0|nr:cell division protein FtsQ/DivIB [Brevundimonas sp.]HRO33416.1 FtsQ-type POTRA domain-containing protein [Brevundimonas sp.]
MPAVVRGGRRQNAQTPRRGAGGSARGKGPRNAPATPAKVSALGRMDLSPRAVMISMAAGCLVLTAVLATGARAERIGAAFSNGVDGVTTGLGLKLRRVHVTGASAEAKPVIERALQLQTGMPIAGLDLDELQQRAQSVGWVKEARVVRLLPDTLIVEITEHDRLAVWQNAGRVHVIDGQGQVIAGAQAARYPQLPLVVGLGADQAAADILPLLAQRPRLMGRVDALVRVDERRWDLRLKDGSLIQLPAVGQEEALIRLDALDQRERLLDLGFARVDLRTPEEVAVRPSEGGEA